MIYTTTVLGYGREPNGLVQIVAMAAAVDAETIEGSARLLFAATYAEPVATVSTVTTDDEGAERSTTDWRQCRNAGCDAMGSWKRMSECPTCGGATSPREAA